MFAQAVVATVEHTYLWYMLVDRYTLPKNYGILRKLYLTSWLSLFLFRRIVILSRPIHRCCARRLAWYESEQAFTWTPPCPQAFEPGEKLHAMLPIISAARAMINICAVWSLHIATCKATSPSRVCRKKPRHQLSGTRVSISRCMIAMIKAIHAGKISNKPKRWIPLCTHEAGCKRLDL